eukprot:464729_1
MATDPQNVASQAYIAYVNEKGIAPLKPSYLLNFCKLHKPPFIGVNFTKARDICNNPPKFNSTKNRRRNNVPNSNNNYNDHIVNTNILMSSNPSQMSNSMNSKQIKNNNQPPNNMYQPPNNMYRPPNNMYQPPNNMYQQSRPPPLRQSMVTSNSPIHAATKNMTQPLHKREKTKVFGQDPSVPPPPNTNDYKKSKIFGQDPSVPPPPNTSNKNNKMFGKNPSVPVPVANNQIKKSSQLTPQQLQQMNHIQKQNQQRQIKSGYTPQQLRQLQQQRLMQQRAMNLQKQRLMEQRAMNPQQQQQQIQKQWQQYYQRMARNPQQQQQQMIMQMQQMIANLKRQLQERDKHYHKTIQTTINFKDMEINELRELINRLEEENDCIGELQVQNFQMKKELNTLRGDHQENVFDNLFGNMTLSSAGKSKVKRAGVKKNYGDYDKERRQIMKTIQSEQDQLYKEVFQLHNKPLHQFSTNDICHQIKLWIYSDLNYKKYLSKTIKILWDHSLSGNVISN